MAVLKKADAFISHCGMNSASESLYFGVPIIAFPQTPEQGGVAQRVLELGGGIRLKKAKAAEIFEAAEKLLNDETYKQNAEAVAEGFKRCSGAKGAADKILSLCL